MASLSANQIKFIRSLGQKKFREESGVFIAEGEKVVQEALQSDFTIREVYRTDEIGTECMSRISALSSPSPVLAVIEQKKYTPDHASELLDFLILKGSTTQNTPLCLALDGVRDPGNLGTIIRLADWFGIDVIFASEDTVELYNPKVVQATMGAVFRKTVLYGDLQEILGRFARAGLPIYGTFLDGKNLYQQSVERKGLVVMGSESFGISPQIEQLISHKLFIPPYPEGVVTSESLNVAIATAIICAEFRR